MQSERDSLKKFVSHLFNLNSVTSFNLANIFEIELLVSYGSTKLSYGYTKLFTTAIPSWAMAIPSCSLRLYQVELWLYQVVHYSYTKLSYGCAKLFTTDIPSWAMAIYTKLFTTAIPSWATAIPSWLLRCIISKCHVFTRIRTLLEKHSKFPLFKTWNVEENEILHEKFRAVSRFHRYISCYIEESLFITFGTVYSQSQSQKPEPTVGLRNNAPIFIIFY